MKTVLTGLFSAVRPQQPSTPTVKLENEDDAIPTPSTHTDCQFEDFQTPLCTANTHWKPSGPRLSIKHVDTIREEEENESSQQTSHEALVITLECMARRAHWTERQNIITDISEMLARLRGVPLTVPMPHFLSGDIQAKLLHRLQEAPGVNVPPQLWSANYLGAFGGGKVLTNEWLRAGGKSLAKLIEAISDWDDAICQVQEWEGVTYDRRMPRSLGERLVHCWLDQPAFWRILRTGRSWAVPHIVAMYNKPVPSYFPCFNCGSHVALRVPRVLKGGPRPEVCAARCDLCGRAGSVRFVGVRSIAPREFALQFYNSCLSLSLADPLSPEDVTPDDWALLETVADNSSSLRWLLSLLHYLPPGASSGLMRPPMSRSHCCYACGVGWRIGDSRCNFCGIVASIGSREDGFLYSQGVPKHLLPSLDKGDQSMRIADWGSIYEGLRIESWHVGVPRGFSNRSSSNANSQRTSPIVPNSQPSGLIQRTFRRSESSSTLLDDDFGGPSSTRHYRPPAKRPRSSVLDSPP